LPEAAEQKTWGQPTFRVRAKIFAAIGGGGGFDPAPVSSEARVSMLMKAAPGEQDVLLMVGEPFFRPRYLGYKGWIGVYIDEVTDWSDITRLVEGSYRAIAPNKLVGQLGSAS
jgi:predicted DNA-binding protein (MmcQ/YjbR family)